MNFRKDEEELKKSSDFIKVAYDKYGNPIGVRPVNGDEIPEEKPEKSSRIVSQALHYDTKLIGQWLGVINQNMHILKDQINLLENPNGKIMPLVEEAISKNIIFVNKQIDLMNKELQNYKVLSNSVLEQLNLINENFSLLRKEIGDNGHISMELIAEMGIVKNEVRNIQIPTEIIGMLNSLNENFEILRSRAMEMSRETVQMNDQLNRKLDGIATEEDLDMVISGFISKQEFHETKNELEELIKKTAINKDELISELVAKLKVRKAKRRKMKKIVKKKIRKIRKKRTITVKKSAIRRFLLRKFDLNENERVLVITDHKMEKIGNKVYETCRKINENTVFVVMERMKKPREEPEDSVAEAMKNTDAIIGITWYTLKKTVALRNAVELGARACLISKNLKFSVAK